MELLNAQRTTSYGESASETDRTALPTSLAEATDAREPSAVHPLEAGLHVTGQRIARAPAHSGQGRFHAHAALPFTCCGARANQSCSRVAGTALITPNTPLVSLSGPAVKKSDSGLDLAPPPNSIAQSPSMAIAPPSEIDPKKAYLKGPVLQFPHGNTRAHFWIDPDSGLLR